MNGSWNTQQSVEEREREDREGGRDRRRGRRFGWVCVWRNVVEKTCRINLQKRERKDEWMNGNDV